MVTQIEEKVKEYNGKIENSEEFYPDSYCPKCKKEPQKFKKHDRRNRKLRVIVEGLIQIMMVIIIRWKCPLCKATFSIYPDFMAPHKRYSCTQIVELSKQYLNQETSYQDALRDGNNFIGYQPEDTFINMKKNKDDESIVESFLAPSTLYRWCSWLGSFQSQVSQALDILNQTIFDLNICRQFIPVYPRKYNTEKRKVVLQQALKVFQMSEIKINGKKIFPHFALKLIK